VLRQEIKQDIKQEIEQAYLHIAKTIDDVIDEIHKSTEPIAERVDRIEATMATKDDLSKLETRMNTMDSKLDQILQLLQTKQ
jgi:hypothetical protein